MFPFAILTSIGLAYTYRKLSIGDIANLIPMIYTNYSMKGYFMTEPTKIQTLCEILAAAILRLAGAQVPAVAK